MRVTICRPDQVSEFLPEALSGRLVMAPVAPGQDEAMAAMLRPEVDVVEPGAAVVVATSGSTGRPKGVVLSASALIAAAEAAQQVTGPMTWTNVLPDHYVAGLMVHVRAHLAGTEVRRASAQLDDLCPDPAGRNAISIVPTQLFRAMERPEVMAALSRYDVVLLGGAAVDADLLAEARDRGLNLVTTYGMSETCGGCVWDGRPLPGVRVEVRDQRLCLGGPMAFSGYRLDPELTAATLDHDLVLTNDRGVFTDGVVRVLGRMDDVVISGGVNVDLAQVQRAVDQVLPGVAVVVGLPDAEWGQRVTLVTTDGHDLSWWQDSLRPTLVGPALPRRLERLDVLPLTSSGKIDRRAIIERLG